MPFNSYLVEETQTDQPVLVPNFFFFFSFKAYIQPVSFQILLEFYPFTFAFLAFLDVIFLVIPLNPEVKKSK